MSISVLFLVFQVLKRNKITTLIIGLSITSLNYWSLFYGDKLMPDVFITFSVLLAFYSIYQHKYKSKSAISYSILLAFSLILGFTSKGTIILILPLLAYLFIVDLIFKRNIRFWIYSALFSIILFISYFLLLGVITGDSLIRFKAIADNSYLNLCSYDKQPQEFLIRRISYEFFDMMIKDGMIFSLIFVLASLFSSKVKELLKFNNENSFFIISSVILLLSGNFMTISYSSYVPMCLDPRHYLFIIPIAAIVAANFTEKLLDRKVSFKPLIIILTIIAFVSLYFNYNSTWELYLPTLILLIISVFFFKRSYWKWIFAIAFVIIMAVKPYKSVKSAINLKFTMQNEIINKHINDLSDCFVITNDVQKRLINYYSGFENNSNITYLNYNEFEDYKFDINKPIYLIQNWYTRFLCNKTLKDLPYFAQTIDSSYSVIVKDEKLNIGIYKIDRIKKLNEVFSTFNDYETPIKYWNFNTNNIIDSVSYKGDKSYLFNEYSSTFSYEIDSIVDNMGDYIVIKADLFCKKDDNSISKLVISLDADNTSYLWKSTEINKQIKSYGLWWHVNFEVKFNKNDLKDGSLLKVYIWNPEKTPAYIDNFSVKLYFLD